MTRRTFAMLLTGGLILFAIVSYSEYTVWPMWLDRPGHFIYRLAYYIIFPLRAFVFSFIPRVNHHWPWSHTILATVGTPFFFFAIHKISGHIRRRLKRPQPNPTQPMDKAAFSRRRFLLRGGTAAAGATLMGHAVFYEPGNLKVRNYVIPIRDLPAQFDGLRLIHVSDTHYGPYVPMKYLQRVARKVNELEGDLLVFTGDYIHWTPDALEPGIRWLATMHARIGAVAVLGNHEHWEGTERCRKVFKEIDVPLLDNRNCFVSKHQILPAADGKPGIALAGLGDLWEDTVSYRSALDGIPDTTPRILLAHNPDTAESAPANARIDLMLCGHTHGGQVCLPGIGAPLVPIRHKERYLGGLCQGPHFPVLVSRGVGIAGMPLRVGVPPEIGVILLKPL